VPLLLGLWGATPAVKVAKLREALLPPLLVNVYKYSMSRALIPLWVWLFLIVMVFYGGVVLLRAKNKHYVRFGPIRFSKDDDPICFWVLVADFVVAETIIVGLLVGAIVSVFWGSVF
jgi:hypothetical protein